MFGLPCSSRRRKSEAGQVDFDETQPALQELVRCRTVSYYDPSFEDDTEFEKFVDLLPKLYPEVARECTLTRLPDRALLFKWEGIEHTEPSVLMSHFDVVPVNEEGWTKPPFDAVIDENGILWGRGCLDTKLTLNAIMFSANQLIAQGFKPKQDIYFAFAGNEKSAALGLQT